MYFMTFHCPSNGISYSSTVSHLVIKTAAASAFRFWGGVGGGIIKYRHTAHHKVLKGREASDAGVCLSGILLLSHLFRAFR